MERQLEAFSTHLRSERQVSEHTQLAYRRDLDSILAFCGTPVSYTHLTLPTICSV